MHKREVREQKAAIIIIENQQTWTNHIRSLLGDFVMERQISLSRPMHLKGFAGTRASKQWPRTGAITLDLHTGDTGENGDDFADDGA